DPVEFRLRKQGHELVRDERGALYVLSVGVGAYQDKQVPALKYSPYDARGLAATFHGQRSDVFYHSEALTLVDANATRAGILGGLYWLANKAAPGDTAIVFIAAHGMNDASDVYYVLPSDTRAADVHSMISGPELQDALGNIKSHILLILD